MQRLEKNLAKTFEHSTANPPNDVPQRFRYTDFLDLKKKKVIVCGA